MFLLKYIWKNIMKLLYFIAFTHHGSLYYLRLPFYYLKFYDIGSIKLHLAHDLDTLPKNVRLRSRGLREDLSELCSNPKRHKYRDITLQSWIISNRIEKKLAFMGFEKNDSPKIGYIELKLLLIGSIFCYRDTRLYCDRKLFGFKKAFEKHYSAARWCWRYKPKR
jgi:hypothetical protein